MSNYNISEISGEPTVFNISGLNIDFIVSGLSGNNSKYLFYDASTGRLGLNTSLPDSALHIVAPCANDGLKIEGTTNCPTGVRLLLQHNPGTSPETDSYPASIDLAGRDTNATLINYAQIRSKILSSAQNQTSGELLFRVDNSGSLSDIFRGNISNVVLGGLNEISGHSYNVMGSNNILSGLLYINLGSNNEGSIHSGLLLGNNISVKAEDIVCVSNDASVSGNQIILFGNKVHVTGNNSVVIANNSAVDGDSSIVIGNNASVYKNSNTNLLVLNNGEISGVSGIGLGSWIMVTGHNNLFMGHEVNVTGSNNSVIGSRSYVTGNNNVSYGTNTRISGSYVVSLGTNNALSSVTSGMFIGHDISLMDSKKTIMMGLNNTSNKELDNSVLIGIDNTTLSGEAKDIIFIGQNNVSSNIKNSLVIGNKNNLSGNVNTNIVLGPDNYVASISNNNVIIGGLNNNSGLDINTQGAILGTSAKSTNLLNNSNIIGINNLSFASINGSIFGNKNIVSGNNLNSFGSFNNLKNVSNLQNLGNSNVVYGNNNNVIGSRITLLGKNCIVNNPSERTAYVFGSGSVFFGDNKLVVGGICVGNQNDVHGQDNIVYGNKNILGSAYHKASLTNNTSTLTVSGDVRALYKAGEQILIIVYHPMSDQQTFIRTITLAGNEAQALSYALSNNITTISLGEPISVSGPSYGRKENFDDPIIEKTSSIIECIILPYSLVDTTDNLTKFYGKDNLIFGKNNRYYYNNGLILGNSNNITGINNIIIGNAISGIYNNSLQIGTNNNNKIYLDDTNIVFNTGTLQENIIFRSRTGANLNNSAMMLRLSDNRVAINNSNPRSSLDVSGVITTSGLRVGLSSVSGYSLISNSSGVATWEFPVNLSGVNSGLLYKVSDKVASGSNVLLFNNINKHLSYIYDRIENDTNTLPARYAGVTFTPNALLINETDNEETSYKFKILGSGIGGIQNEEGGTIFGDLASRKILLETLHEFNMLKIWNISGASGHLWRHTVTDRLFVPTNLTGTFLRVSSTDGLLNSFTTSPNCILYSNSASSQTGDSSLKFYSNQSALTIGATGLGLGEHNNLNTSSVNGMNVVINSTSSNIILGSTSAIGTVFNNAGNSTHPFSIYNFNNGATQTRLGLHYSTRSGVLAVGASHNSTYIPTRNAAAAAWDSLRIGTSGVKLLVDGTARVHGLQLVPNNSFPNTTINSYLRINDDGFVFPGALDLNTVFSGVWPILTSVNQGLTTIGLSNRIGSDNTAATAGPIQNGSLIVWNGNQWINGARGLTLYQSLANNGVNNIRGPIIGVNIAGYVNVMNNSMTFAGAPFREENGVPVSGYLGSNQCSKHFLKGRTIGNTDTQLISNFNKSVSIDPINGNPLTQSELNANTISLESYWRPGQPNNIVSRSGELGIWNYTVNYCGLIGEVVTGTEIVPGTNWNAVAGKIEGAFLFYNKTPDGFVAIELGQPNHQFWASSIYASSGWSTGSLPMRVVLQDRTMKISARGLPNTNILWNCSVDIHELNHPNTVRVSANT